MSIRAEFHCEVCDITMNKKSQAKHMRSTSHLNRVNGVERQPASTKFTCDACNITISTKSKVRHMRSANHLKKTGQEQEEKKVEVEEEPTEENVIAKIKEYNKKIKKIKRERDEYLQKHRAIVDEYIRRQEAEQEAEQEQQEEQQQEQQEEQEE